MPVVCSGGNLTKEIHTESGDIGICWGKKVSPSICIFVYMHTKASIRIMLKLRGSTFLHSYIAAITMSSYIYIRLCAMRSTQIQGCNHKASSMHLAKDAFEMPERCGDWVLQSHNTRINGEPMGLQ